MWYDNNMTQKYHIGYVLESGRGVIVDGPLRGNYSNNKQYIKWKVKCLDCGSEKWKYSNTFNGLKYGCKQCYDESLKRFDDLPAKKKAWMSLRTNAKSRNLNVDLTFDEFCELAKDNCFYCDGEPVLKHGYKDWQSEVYLNGIDQMDNSFGYTLENSVACCYQCNWSKRDLPIDEWSKWIMNVSSNLRKAW